MISEIYIRRPLWDIGGAAAHYAGVCCNIVWCYRSKFDGWILHLIGVQ